MKLEKVKIGFCLTGSFCTFKKTIMQIKEIVKLGAEVIPIMSYNAFGLDTKFGDAKDFIEQIEEITGNKILHTIQDTEPIGPKKMTDIMIIAPCSRKYNCKISKWNNRYTSFNGRKIAPNLVAGDELIDNIKYYRIFNKIGNGVFIYIWKNIQLK